MGEDILKWHLVQVILHELYHMLDESDNSILVREQNAQAFSYDMFKLLYGSSMEPPFARIGDGLKSVINSSHNASEDKLISCS